MIQNYTIQLAGEHHVRAIPAIEQAAAAIFPELDLPPDIRYLVTDNETLMVAQSEKRLWAALDDNKTLVGFALARIVGAYAHLEELDVHPDHGRQGVGSRLLRAVISWATDGGFPGITLITFRHLPWNAPFYERHGFVRLDDSNTGNSLRELIREEADAGIEPGNRVAMIYGINDGSGSAEARRRA
jgi:GNAT superfamily N-acetyltransferase